MKRMICSLLLRWWRGIRNVEPPNAPLHPPDVLPLLHFLRWNVKCPEVFSLKKKCRVHSHSGFYCVVCNEIDLELMHHTTLVHKTNHKFHIIWFFALILWMSIMIHLTKHHFNLEASSSLMSSRHKKTLRLKDHTRSIKRARYVCFVVINQKIFESWDLWTKN